MSDNEHVRKALEEPFPQSAIKQRQGGGNSRFSYVEGFTIIRRLNEATGGTWDWAIKSFEFRPLPPTRQGKDQSLVVVTGELTIPGLGTRAGVGVQKVSEDGGEDLVKGASTDALKKAATLFGVALELYGPDYEAGETAAPQRQQPRPITPAVGAASDNALLDSIRNDLLNPDARWDALWDFMDRAATVAELNQRAEKVKDSGMPKRDLSAAYKQVHTRLAQALAPGQAD